MLHAKRWWIEVWKCIQLCKVPEAWIHCCEIPKVQKPHCDVLGCCIRIQRCFNYARLPTPGPLPGCFYALWERGPSPDSLHSGTLLALISRRCVFEWQWLINVGALQTFVNEARIPVQTYIQLNTMDVLRFGFDILFARAITYTVYCLSYFFSLDIPTLIQSTGRKACAKFLPPLIILLLIILCHDLSLLSEYLIIYLTCGIYGQNKADALE